MIKKRVLISILAAAFALTALAYSSTTALAQSVPIRVLLEPSLVADIVYDFQEGVAAVRIIDPEDDSFMLGYVNRYGEVVIPFWTYRAVTHWETPEFSNGLVSVYSRETGVIAFYDTAGTMAIPFLYDRVPGRVSEFQFGLAAVSYDGLWGFIDTAGNIQIPFEFERAGNFSEGLAPVMQGGNWGFIDTTGDIVIPFVLDHFANETEGNLFFAPGFSEGLAAILLPDGQNFGWGFMTRAGNRVASTIYNYVEDFTEGRALVMREDENGIPVFGFIDNMGEEIVSAVYSFAHSFSEELAAVRYGGLEDGFWGFIDHYGSVQVPLMYHEARSFSEGLAAVRIGDVETGRWGFIDRWGNEVVPTIYNEVRDFSNGFAAVRLGEEEDAQWGFIDRTGGIIVPIEYHAAQSFSEGLAWVRGVNGWGILKFDPTAGQATEPEHIFSRYIHQDIAAEFTFTMPDGALSRVTSPASASEVISYVIGGLTPAQRQSGTALNIVTLFIENAIRLGTSRNLPADGILGADILQSAADTAYNISQTLVNENIQLMRRLNSNINFTADGQDVLHLSFTDNVSGIQFDNITVETDFAMLALSRGQIHAGSEIRIERGGAVQAFASAGLEAPVSTYIAIGTGGIFGDDFRPIDLLRFWSIGAVTLLMIVWGILASMGHKLRTWVVPTFSVLLIAINIWTLRLNQDTSGAVNTREAGYIDSVVVSMPPGMQATLSIPIHDINQVELVLLNERGEPQISRHNPVTDTIDAIIHSSGTFNLHMHHGHNDVAAESLSPQTQRAISVLTTMGIMQGEAHDFHPDSAITRAELADAVVMALGLLDNSLANSFTDISPDDWYYHAVATAEQLNLMHGFDDGSFRGGWAISKEDFVFTLAGALQHMGYYVPADIDGILVRYDDHALLESWSKPAIALVTAADVLIYREDGLFAPESVMSRGDAAVVLYRLFGRLW